jgi:hypothetical protein
VEQKLAFLIPLETAQRYVPELHLCKAHWCTNEGKASGRPLGDLSYVDGTPLNTDETAAAAMRHYGQILHPTIDDIRFLDRGEEGSAPPLGKPQAVENGPNGRLYVTVVQTGGRRTVRDAPHGRPSISADRRNFRLGEDPRSLPSSNESHIVGTAACLAEQHADVCGRHHRGVFAEDVEKDLAKAQEIWTILLGSGAVADDKTETGTRLDIFGYTVDLETKRVSIAKKTFLTALHGFIGTDVTKRLNLRTAQRLASCKFGLIHFIALITECFGVFPLLEFWKFSSY